MVTLPSEPEKDPEAAPSPGGRSHLEREVAEGFGTDAGRYDRARPTYPADLIQRIVAASPGRDFLDAGCGTGISSRLFQAAGCRVLGVDPDPRMAGQARQGGTEAEVAKFEDWDPAGRTFDAVTAAQAWHWVDPAAGAAKAAAVLRPGRQARRLLERLRTAGRSCARRSARSTGGCCPARRAAASGPGPRSTATGSWAAGRPTGCGRRARSASRRSGCRTGQRPYTRDEWLDLVPTTGGFGRLPAARPGGRSSPASARPSTRRAAPSPWATPPSRSPRPGRRPSPLTPWRGGLPG